MKLACMRSWANNQDDPWVHFVRFEDVKSRPEQVISEILKLSGAKCDMNFASNIAKSYSKSKMRERDLGKREPGAKSHYRIQSSSHVEAFEPHHYDHFYDVTGNLVDLLGYPR